jgi:iron complex outermembrane receptor protein
MIRERLLLGCAFIASAVINSTTMAQEANTATLDEVVVTAQKRSENLQEIPKQVQVVSTENLQNANVTSLADLVKLVPSLSGPNGNGMGGLTSMRGVGTAAPSIGAASKVGIVLDDVPIPSRAASVRNLLDIQQVEVLPGPQGTLAGRNATGGLINMVTRAPSRDATTGIFQASVAGYHEYVAGAYVSAPINEQFAFGVSANYQYQRGMAYNAALNQWDVATDSLGFRGKLLWSPNEDSELTLTVAHSRDKQEGGGSGGFSSIYRQIDVPLNTITSGLECVTQTSPTACSASPAGKKTFTQLFPGITPSPDNVTYYSLFEAAQIRTNDTVSLKYEHTFAPGTFTFIGSNLKELYPQDQVWLNYPNVNLISRPEFDGFAHILNHSKSKTLEARFASNTDTPWTYLGGVFWSDVENRYDYQRYHQLFRANRVFGQGSQALFASTSYRFATDTTVRVGARYEKDDIDYLWAYYSDPATTKTLQNGIVLNFPAYGWPTTSAKHSDSYVNYDFGVQQKLGADAMIYFNYAYANQGPLYDAESTTERDRNSTVPLSPLPSEEVNSIEIGLKSEWLDNRLLLNVNVFDMKYDNYQALTNVTDTANPNAVPQLRTYAAGKVSSRGIELTSSALLTDHFRLDVAGMYNKAVIDEWFYAPCFANQTAAEGCLNGLVPGEPVARGYQRDISGNLLANAPKYKLTAIGTYSGNLGFNSAVSYDASLTVRYNSKQAGDQLGAPNLALPETTYVDTNLTFTKGNMQLSVFGINLFEEFAETFGTGLGAGLSSALGGASTGRQPDGSYPIKVRNLDRSNLRYFGARVKYSF